MLITEIGGNPCKIGKTSITVKHPETGKTMGIVRDVLTFAEDQKQFRRLTEWRQKHWVTPDIMSQVVEADGICYYILDVRALDFFEDMEQRYGLPESDRKSRDKRLEDARTAEAAGITVLRLNLY